MSPRSHSMWEAQILQSWSQVRAWAFHYVRKVLLEIESRAFAWQRYALPLGYIPSQLCTSFFATGLHYITMSVFEIWIVRFWGAEYRKRRESIPDFRQDCVLFKLRRDSCLPECWRQLRCVWWEIIWRLGHEEVGAAAGVYVSPFLGPLAQVGQAILSNRLSQAVSPEFWEWLIQWDWSNAAVSENF